MISNIDPNIARQNAAADELKSQTRQMSNLLKSGDVDKEKKIREACEGFETIFVQKMWEQMRSSVSKAGLLESREEHYWQSMYDQELAKKMTEAGGIGLADMMFEQLSKDLSNASQASSGRGVPIAISPAPLFTPKSNEDEVVAEAIASLSSMVNGQNKNMTGMNNLYEELTIDEITPENIELMELSMANELLENELNSLEDQAKKNGSLESQLLANAKLSTANLMQANPDLVGGNLSKEILKKELAENINL